MTERRPSYPTTERKNTFALLAQVQRCGFYAESGKIMTAAHNAARGGWAEDLRIQLSSYPAVKFIRETVSLEKLPNFLEDPLCVEVIRDAVVQNQKEIDKRYLSIVGSCDYPALGIKTFMEGSKNDKFLTWVSEVNSIHVGREALANLILKKKDSAESVRIFVKSDELDDIITKIPFERVVHLEHITGQQKSLLGQPGILSLMATFYRTGELTPWHIRLALLKEFVHLRGLSEVEDSDVTALAFSQFVARMRPFARQEFLEKWQESPLGEKQLVLASLRNGLSSVDLSAYRKFVKKNIKQPCGSDYLARVREEEDPMHPLAHLKAKIGFEREHEIPRGLLDRDFAVLDSLGFKKGGQPEPQTEDSPGPFQSAFTARRVYLLYQKYGLVDNYKFYKTSFHLNVGVSRQEGIPTFLRWLQATGYGYEPTFSSNAILTRAHNSQIERKSKDESGGIYHEFKAFDSLTATGMARLLKRGSSISHALLAYQAACKQLIKKEEGSTLERTLSHDEIMKSSLTVDQKRLAVIWVKYEALVQQAFHKAGVLRAIHTSPQGSDMTAFARKIEKALPTHWDRYHANPTQSPGLVGETRMLLLRAHNEVERVLKEAMKDFKLQLTDVINFPTLQKRDSFFERFPCGVNEDKHREVLELFARKYKIKKSAR